MRLSPKRYRKLTTRYAHNIKSIIASMQRIRDVYYRMMVAPEYLPKYLSMLESCGLTDDPFIVDHNHRATGTVETVNGDVPTFEYAVSIVQSLDTAIDEQRENYLAFCKALRNLVPANQQANL